MRFFSALVAGALAIVAAAQTTGSQPNPFTNSDFSGISTTSVFTITWTPTTPGAVSIWLVQGDTEDSMVQKELLVSNLPNTGSYQWTPDSTTPKASNYALKIVSDSDDSLYNYSERFPIESDVTSSASSAQSSTNAPSSTASSPTSTDAPSSTTDNSSSSTAESSTDNNSSTTMATSTTSSPSSTAPASSSSTGAAATGSAKVGAGLIGFVGAAMLLL